MRHARRLRCSLTVESKMGSVVDLKKKATLLAKTATLLNQNRVASAAAILLLTSGSYTYYLKTLAAHARRRKHKCVGNSASRLIMSFRIMFRMNTQKLQALCKIKQQSQQLLAFETSTSRTTYCSVKAGRDFPHVSPGLIKRWMQRNLQALKRMGNRAILSRSCSTICCPSLESASCSCWGWQSSAQPSPTGLRECRCTLQPLWRTSQEYKVETLVGANNEAVVSWYAGLHVQGSFSAEGSPLYPQLFRERHPLLGSCSHRVHFKPLPAAPEAGLEERAHHSRSQAVLRPDGACSALLPLPSVLKSALARTTFLSL